MDLNDLESKLGKAKASGATVGIVLSQIQAKCYLDLARRQESQLATIHQSLEEQVELNVRQVHTIAEMQVRMGALINEKAEAEARVYALVDLHVVQSAAEAAQADAPAVPVLCNAMCERKTADIMQRDGYAKTGYVLMTEDPAARICVSDQGAVAWFTRDEWNWLMHNRDHVEFAWPKPVGAPAAPAAPVVTVDTPQVTAYLKIDGADREYNTIDEFSGGRTGGMALVSLVNAQAYTAAAVAQALADERDRCAKLATQWGMARNPDGGGNALFNFAEAVRLGVQVDERDTDYHWSKSPVAKTAALIERAEKAEQALEEWRFTNKIDELYREVDRLRAQASNIGDANGKA